MEHEMQWLPRTQALAAEQLEYLCRGCRVHHEQDHHGRDDDIVSHDAT